MPNNCQSLNRNTWKLALPTFWKRGRIVYLNSKFFVQSLLWAKLLCHRNHCFGHGCGGFSAWSVKRGAQISPSEHWVWSLGKEKWNSWDVCMLRVINLFCWQGFRAMPLLLHKIDFEVWFSALSSPQSWLHLSPISLRGSYLAQSITKTGQPDEWTVWMIEAVSHSCFLPLCHSALYICAYQFSLTCGLLSFWGCPQQEPLVTCNHFMDSMKSCSWWICITGHCVQAVSQSQ